MVFLFLLVACAALGAPEDTAGWILCYCTAHHISQFVWQMHRCIGTNVSRQQNRTRFLFSSPWFHGNSSTETALVLEVIIDCRQFDRCASALYYNMNCVDFSSSLFIPAAVAVATGVHSIWSTGLPFVHCHKMAQWSRAVAKYFEYLLSVAFASLFDLADLGYCCLQLFITFFRPLRLMFVSMRLCAWRGKPVRNFLYNNNQDDHQSHMLSGILASQQQTTGG